MNRIFLSTIILLVLSIVSFAQNGVDEKKLEGLLTLSKQKQTEANNSLGAGDFNQAAISYGDVIKAFSDLTNREEIELTEETLHLFYEKRATVYLAAKQDKLSDADFQKYIQFRLTRGKKSLAKANAETKTGNVEKGIWLSDAFSDLLKVYTTVDKRNQVFATVYKKNPDSNLLSEAELKEVDGILKDVMLGWGRVETITFLENGAVKNADSAIEKLNFVIKRAPGEIEAYQLLAKIYRKQGKTELADANQSKAELLKKNQ
jgi:tetratricopeptide (TPR) repeat protein